jgi:SP family sugar:H+ symporter-like MFS transporter
MAISPFKKNRNADSSNATTAVPSLNHSQSDVGPNVQPASNGLPTKGDGRLTSKIPNVTIRTVIMATLVAMGGFIFGYDTGQISGFLEMRVFLERFGIQTSITKDHPYGYYFTNVRSGLIVGLVCFLVPPGIADAHSFQLSIGTLIGCLIAGPVSNRIGRKWSITPWCMVFCVGVIVQMAVGPGQWVGIVMGRWVAGLGVGALSVLVPLYMSETSPVPVRGAVVS